MQPGPLTPASLPPGSRVGPWRIVDARGRGTYGAVYLAEGVAPEAAGLAALKLALHPWDERFGREAELLARLRCPAVPRLLDHGQWQSPAGVRHPYLAMQLVDGIPLYAWARAFGPSSRQVLRVLAQLARALEATHAAGGVHRDVKGDNVLVRLSDGQAFLVDFGSGTYPGAAPLTGTVFPPGTPPYRSPEAYRFALNILKSPVKVHAPTPAEDVFALGVTAYKLVTDEYPPSPQPLDVRFHVWKTDGPGPDPASRLNRRCAPELSALISRMLSRQPEARGTARELARALERAARKSGPEADAPLFRGQAPRRGYAEAASRSHESLGSGWPWLAAAGVAGAVVLGVASARGTPGLKDEPQARSSQPLEARDAGTVGLGDSVLTASAESSHEPTTVMPIGLDLPDKPFSGQYRPDARGRCPRQTMVPINGGCWHPVTVSVEQCRKEAYVYDGKCYEPAFPPPRPTTSSPTDSPDGG
jgi:serine/threonine-protein kinase